MSLSSALSLLRGRTTCCRCVSNCLKLWTPTQKTAQEKQVLDIRKTLDLSCYSFLNQRFAGHPWTPLSSLDQHHTNAWQHLYMSLIVSDVARINQFWRKVFVDHWCVAPRHRSRQFQRSPHRSWFFRTYQKHGHNRKTGHMTSTIIPPSWLTTNYHVRWHLKRIHMMHIQTELRPSRSNLVQQFLSGGLRRACAHKEAHLDALMLGCRPHPQHPWDFWKGREPRNLNSEQMLSFIQLFSLQVLPLLQTFLLGLQSSMKAHRPPTPLWESARCLAKGPSSKKPLAASINALEV